jgi:hypothetical protein
VPGPISSSEAAQAPTTPKQGADESIIYLLVTISPDQPWPRSQCSS